MIKINLLGDETIIDNSARYALFGVLASVAALLMLFFAMQNSLGTEISDLSEKKETLEKELARLQKITKEVRDLETKQEEYNAKLVVIATLKKSKAGPVRVLDDLNLALPEKAWLTEAKESSGVLTLVGRALDEQTIASFMRDLEKSDYFEQVDPVEIKQIDMDGVKIKEFAVTAMISYTGRVEPLPAEVDAADKAAVGGGAPAASAGSVPLMKIPAEVKKKVTTEVDEIPAASAQNLMPENGIIALRTERSLLQTSVRRRS